ncbi:MAG: preprotein translocase subunit SecG [Candidatus Paceibacterota bacterium]|jgi:protein translocase SecG subunit
MNLATILPYIQITLAILLTIGVMLQQSDAGAGSAFGGGDNFGSGMHTRRGFEKFLFYATIIVAILFVISAFTAIFLNR